MRGLLDSVLDNPILVKHVRSRLRPGQAVPWAVIVLALSACIAWAGLVSNWFSSATAVILLLGLQVAILALVGSNQINASLGGARESGILAFHRVSPLPPSVVALGFFLGAPIREYAFTAIAVPFAVFAAYHIDEFSPRKGLLWVAQLEAALLLSTWVVHAAAMLGCLNRKKPRGSIQGTIVTIILLIFFGAYGSVGFYFGAQWLLNQDPRLNFFGRMIPWLAWLLIYELPALGFLGLAVARKMKAERAHSYTKPQALVCMATLAALVLGGLWGVARLLPEGGLPSEPTPADAMMLTVVYVLAVAAIVLSVTITPGSGEYVKGVRRALREGRRRPGPWSDAGGNQIALFALAALVLIGASAVVNVVGRPPFDPEMHRRVRIWANQEQPIPKALLSDKAWLESRQMLMSRPIVIAVLTVAYVGLANQYYSRRTRRSGMVLLVLFIFVAWIVPLLAGAIIGMSSTPSEALAVTILALSPLPGIALSSGLGESDSAGAIQLAALAPPITFAFVFKYLLVVAQRRIDRALRDQEKPPASRGPFAIGEPA